MSELVGVQGREGSYHEEAARSLWGENVDIAYIDTFRELFDSIRTGKVGRGVVAIANNSIGFIPETYALLVSEEASKYQIRGETYVRVEHQLLGLPGTNLSQVREVHSQSPAINQCTDFLETHLPRFTVVEQDDTALSAELVSTWGDPTKAAIASRTAGKLHGLEPIAANIQDDPDNITRFLILEKRADSQEIADSDKTSAILQTGQAPGSLYKALGVFADREVNIATLHSAFVPNSAFKMKFLIEFDAGAEEAEVITKELRAMSCQLATLGSYQCSEIPVKETTK